VAEFTVVGVDTTDADLESKELPIPLRILVSLAALFWVSKTEVAVTSFVFELDVRGCCFPRLLTS
jgi:hypothetical protein